MLSVNSFIALVTFPLYISRVNFLGSSVTADGVFAGLEYFWIVSPSCSNYSISPDFHKSIRGSNASKCSLDFDSCDGFCNNKLDITKFALNVVPLIGESCNHSFISLQSVS